MAAVIQELFINPPLVVARLGGGSTPQEAYQWVDSPNPRSPGETVVVPDWSLAVQADGSVTPHMPSAVRLRDGALIRPVAPFLEIWARLGEPGSAAGTWQDAPLTPALLTAQGVALADVLFRVNAINAKAARRTANAALRYGTFPPATVRADDNRSVPIVGVSPPGVTQAMIPPGQGIPMGSLQVMRSRPQPASGATLWADQVNVEVLRLRFTPAAGYAYGPPSSAQPNPTSPQNSATPVDDPSRAFLNARAGWAGVSVDAPDLPGDTYDGADVGDDRSLGVVDDTCEARIEVSFALPQQAGRVVSAAANVFVAPPDFAPDRRPFLSLADELNDRMADAAARSAQLSPAERDLWVENLFERIQETVSLFNVDFQRQSRAATLTGNQLTTAIPQDRTLPATDAMGGRDALRNPLFAVAAPTPPEPLPLTEHARMRHRALSDLQALRNFVQQKPGRLRELIRAPFEVRRNESADASTMAMPPFMRNSNAQPLTLSVWQYELLMKWVAETEAGVAAPGGPAPVASPAGPVAQPVSEAAEERRRQILDRVRADGQNP